MLTETQWKTETWGNAGIRALRARAAALFGEKGLPEVRNELYKYSNIQRLFTENGFHEAPVSCGIAGIDLPELPFRVSGHIVLYNGIYQPALSVLPAGIQAGPVSGALDPGRAEQAFALPEADALKALALATATEGVAVHIGKGLKPDAPLLIFSYTDMPDAAYRSALHSVTAGEGASADMVILHGHPGGKRFFSQQVWQFFTETGASLRIHDMQDEGKESFAVAHFSALQQQNSTFSLTTASMGSAFRRNNVRADHAGRGCHTELNGLFMPAASQHIDNRTFVGHMQPDCTSNELYKGIAAANGRGIFNGKVYVARDAQKTNAYQSNKNVLLSPEATINSKPELEIYADDVKCSHGSTTGQLDDDSIFYMQARGIRRSEARKLLLLAFASDVFERIASEDIRHYFEQVAETRFAELYRQA